MNLEIKPAGQDGKTPGLPLSSTIDYVPPQSNPVDEKGDKPQIISPPDAYLLAQASNPRLLATTIIRTPASTDDIEFDVDPSIQQFDSDPAKIIGKLLGNTYKVESLIGSGGMAHVYAAFDITNENKPVAIKVIKTLNPGLIDKKLLRRFIREGETMQNLEHEHILPIYKFGNDAGIQYIAMELIEGGTLRAPKTRLTLEQKLLMVSDVCIALHMAHQNDIIHRDIKPENLLLTCREKTDEFGSRPIAKLGDFGLVLIPDASRISRSQDIVGSAYYMSPEQAHGERNLTGFADLYSIGIILYEFVTGKVPFDGGGNLLSVLDQQRTAIPKPPSELLLKTLPGLEPLIMTLLHKGPVDRHYQSAEQVAQAIRDIVCPKKLQLEISPPPN